MADFRVGEVVDITIKGARVKEVCYHGDGSGADLRFTYVANDGVPWPNAVWADAPGVTVTRVAPAEWPPQPGDLWRDRNGNLHFAAYYSPDYDDTEDSSGIDDQGVRVVLLSQGLDSSCAPGHQMHRPEHVNQQYGPLTLIHREEPPEAEGQVRDA